jgi:hypothetical protein
MKSVFHFYSCEKCVVTFAVEAHEEIDHSGVVCNLCMTDMHLEEVATNVLVDLGN